MISRRQLLGAAGVAPFFVHAGVSRATERRVFTTSIAIEDGRVWIAAMIGDSGPHHFVIDTGGFVSLIDDALARQLRLRAVGSRRLIGVGGLVDILFYEARDIRFSSGLRQASAVFGGFRESLGPNAAGSFAAGLFTARDSDLDFARGEWRLYPDGRGDWSGYEQLPSQIRNDDLRTGSAFVFVDVVLDGQSYHLLADTGMPEQLLLFPRAARRSGLWSDATPWTPDRDRGIGGNAALGRLVRGGRLSIGSFAFERPLVRLSNPSSLQRAVDADGIIGLELLQQLNLSTDVRRHRLWAQRNGRPATPERYGMSGLWADEQGDRLVLVAVSPHSPAAEAGLQVGDEIRGVSLPDWIRRLGGQPGDVVEIDYHRAGQPRHARLTLRPFL